MFVIIFNVASNPLQCYQFSMICRFWYTRIKYSSIPLLREIFFIFVQSKVGAIPKTVSGIELFCEKNGEWNIEGVSDKELFDFKIKYNKKVLVLEFIYAPTWSRKKYKFTVFFLSRSSSSVKLHTIFFLLETEYLLL